MSVQLRTQMRTGPVHIEFRMRALSIAGATAAVLLAGCSASITRFDNPSFALGEGAGTGAKRSVAPLDTTPRSAAGQPSTNQPAPARGANSVEIAALPALQDRTAPATNGASAGPARAMAVTRQPPSPAAATAPIQVASVAKGEQIEVQPGDTLYAIGKRHKVLISDLMAANELRNPNIKPGQKLYLPAADGRATPKVKPERTAALKPAAEPSALAAPTTAVADGASTYVVKPGDSLYAIAARHKIKVLDLQRANGITDVSKVKPGTVLKMPSGDGSAVAPTAPQLAGETMQPETRIVRVAATPPSAESTAPAGVKVLNSSDSPAAAAPPAPFVSANAAAAAPQAVAAKTGKLRWPARGRVVQGFGPRSDGSHNDGVDIAVPAGTDVLAAEDGVVAYAGNEVKTYGNLVLVRHDNGWVTAYANNDKLLVQRGDRVKRGQPVAKAGKSGGAEQPQVHFEVRVGSKPVDPVGYLEKL